MIMSCIYFPPSDGKKLKGDRKVVDEELMAATVLSWLL